VVRVSQRVREVDAIQTLNPKHQKPGGACASARLVILSNNRMTKSEKSKLAVEKAAAYLLSCGIRLPPFKLTTEPPERGHYGGSFVDGHGGKLRLNIGWYPVAFARNWFAMHELGHLLWNEHHPLRWKRFRAEFGEPQPEDYEDFAAKEAWKTMLAGRLNWRPGIHRPKGEPSWYGARAGGEERFCELLGLMWAHGNFDVSPPKDLTALWDCCWKHGLSRMT
jgi:hypothetical protein